MILLPNTAQHLIATSGATVFQPMLGQAQLMTEYGDGCVLNLHETCLING